VNLAIRESLIILTAIAVGRMVAVAQEDHSKHQHAAAGLGTVDFPTSCNASAQKWISQGAALLHSFGYEEARLAFNQAAAADTSGPMPSPGRSAILTAVRW